MEIGYKSSESAFSRDVVGPWKFCDDKDIRRVVGKNDTPLKLSAMADIGRIDPEDISKIDKWQCIICFAYVKPSNLC